MKGILFVLFIAYTTTALAKDAIWKIAFSDGIIVCGYVNNGGYLNFTGPNINVSNNDYKVILGMLPSLRFKEDRGIPRNSIVTPNLGIGVTYCYKRYTIQLPLYYDAKTIVNNGKWHIGFGLGLRINNYSTKK